MINFTTDTDCCTAFDYKTIGSKVERNGDFLVALEKALKDHDTSKDRVPGQHFVVMPESAFEFVSAGDGLASADPNDYVIRVHREGPKMFLRREKAGDVRFCAVVVYTREAYLKDPDVTAEKAAELDPDATHVIVAVIASSGPAAPVTPFRFVHNLAGGNNEYQRPACEDMDDREVIDALVGHIDWLKSKASEVKDYWTKYAVVAD